MDTSFGGIRFPIEWVADEFHYTDLVSPGSVYESLSITPFDDVFMTRYVDAMIDFVKKCAEQKYKEIAFSKVSEVKAEKRTTVVIRRRTKERYEKELLASYNAMIDAWNDYVLEGVRLGYFFWVPHSHDLTDDLRFKNQLSIQYVGDYDDPQNLWHNVVAQLGVDIIQYKTEIIDKVAKKVAEMWESFIDAMLSDSDE